ncbi:MAG: electron transfer flavoprotein subunit beta, partial [Actinobacteria bacterium]|nr:electron transfer flavoprotein subunit beta [Actinomycetota bacterium]
MRIFVLVKEVPDTYGDRKLDLETGLANRGAGEVVLDEITERALEVALSYADANPGTEVVALSMAPESATASIRRALAIGAGSAVHVVDEALRGADLGLTAAVLAAALRRGEADLVLTGNLSTDGSGGVIPAMLAEHLGFAQATALSALAIGADAVTATRATDFGSQQVTVPLPAVISITEALPDARFPNFKGIMAAKKKPL